MSVMSDTTSDLKIQAAIPKTAVLDSNKKNPMPAYPTISNQDRLATVKYRAPTAKISKSFMTQPVTMSLNTAPVPIMQSRRDNVNESKEHSETGPQFEICHFDDGEVTENHFDQAMSKFAGKFLTAALAWVTFASPQAAFAGDIESGQTIFNGNCAACHAGGNNVIQAEKTL